VKTIILAGGFGSRLGNITESIPKPMVKIGNKPILWNIMKIYSKFGYKDFIVCLGYKAEKIIEYFINYSSYNNDFTINLDTNELELHTNNNENNWNITLIHTGLNSLKGARVKKIEKYCDDEINMLTYGDGLADINIKKLVEFHQSHKKMVTITGVHPPSRFGAIAIKNLRVLSFQEKLQTSEGLINGGFMVFNKKMLDYLTEDKNCDLEFGLFERLAKKGEIMVYKHDGQWACIDTERDLNYLIKLWDNNQAFWKIW